MSSWFERYNPHTISDLYFNNYSVKNVVNWLESFEKNKRKFLKIKNSKTKRKKKAKKSWKLSEECSCILVIGSHGTGKTTSVSVILKELGYSRSTYSFKGKRKEIDDIVNDLTSNIDIMSFITVDGANDQRKMVLVVDEIETITSTNEKSQITALKKSNDNCWHLPIIFISNNHHNKFISNIKETAFWVRFNAPPNYEIVTMLERIARIEDICINDTVKTVIASHCQGDIRRLIYTCKNLKYIYGNDFITLEIFEDYAKTSKMKDIDIGLFDATHGLLFDYESVDKCIEYYETEKVQLPLMVHTHYVDKVLSNTDNIDHQFWTINKIAECLSMGDIIENYIYGDQNWAIQRVHGCYTCVAPSYYMCKDMTDDPVDIEINYTLDFNKTSIQKINNKNKSNADKCFKRKEIFDYIYLNKIVRKFLQEENGIKKCVKLLAPYKVGLDTIESLLKIDKIKSTKMNLASKQQKEFKKYLNAKFVKTL